MASLESYFKVSLLEELERFPQLKTEDIVELQRWLTTQPQIPQLPEILIAHFLQSCSFDLKLAKKTMELNFKYKRSMMEFFDEWDPLSSDVLRQAEEVQFVVFLPRRSALLPRVKLTKFRENSVPAFSFVHLSKWLVMSYQSMIFEEGQQDVHIAFDAGTMTLKHLLKFPFQTVRRHQEYMFNASTTRMAGIHFFNTNFVVMRLYSIYKWFASKEVLDRVHFYARAEDYFNTLAADVVPKDYGGAGPSLLDLHEENKNRVIACRAALKAFCEYK